MPKFVPATKYQSYLKLGLSGPWGSGKTYTALNIATHLSEKGIAVIDAESGSTSKYANIFKFDMNDLTLDDNDKEVAEPFTPQRYIDAMKEAYTSGLYDVLIIDGISPEWDDAGGTLQMVDKLTRKYRSEGEKSATRTAWSLATPPHKNFINYILRIKMHVICTMLAKKEEVVTKDAQGVTSKKKTLEPIQREDVPRVFDIFAKMEEKDLIIDKTRCPELDDQIIHKPGKEVADILKEWLKGAPMPERPEYDPDATPISKDRLNGLYVFGRTAGLYTAPPGFANTVKLALELETPIDVKMLTETQAKSFEDYVRIRELQAASERATAQQANGTVAQAN